MIKFWGVLAGITAAFTGAGYAVATVHAAGTDGNQPQAYVQSLGLQAGRRLAGVKAPPILDSLQAPDRTRAREMAETLSTAITEFDNVAAPLAAGAVEMTRARQLADSAAAQLRTVNAEPIDAWMAEALKDRANPMRDLALDAGTGLRENAMLVSLAGPAAVPAIEGAPVVAVALQAPVVEPAPAILPEVVAIQAIVEPPAKPAEPVTVTTVITEPPKPASKPAAEIAAMVETAVVTKNPVAIVTPSATDISVTLPELTTAGGYPPAPPAIEAAVVVVAAVSKAVDQPVAEPVAKSVAKSVVVEKPKDVQIAQTKAAEPAAPKVEAQKLDPAPAAKPVEKTAAVAVQSSDVAVDDFFLTGVMSSEITGRAPAGSIVTVMSGKQELGGTFADANGKWLLQLPQPMAAGDYNLEAFATKGADDPAPLKSAARKVTVPAVSNGKNAITAAGIGTDGGTGNASPTDVPEATAAQETGKPAATDAAKDPAAVAKVPETPPAGGEGGILEDAGAMASAFSDKVTEFFGGETSKPPGDTAGQGTTEPPTETAKALDVKAPEAPAATPPADTTVAAKTPDVATETAAESAPAKVAEPAKPVAEDSTKTALNMPEETLSFSSVRFTPKGSKKGTVTTSGRGPAGQTVRIYVDKESIGRTKVTDKGRWLHEADLYLAPGQHAVRAELLDNAGKVLAETAFPFDRAAAPVVVAETEKPSEAAGAGDNAAAVVPDKVVITAVRIEPGSAAGAPASVVVTGKGAPGARMEVGIDGEAVATAIAAEDGGWSVTQPIKLDAGSHSASVRTRDVGGAVIAQHAMGFTVPAAQSVAEAPKAAAPDAPVKPETKVAEPAKSPVAEPPAKTTIADEQATPAKSKSKSRLAERTVKRRVNRERVAEKASKRRRGKDNATATRSAKRLAQSRIVKRKRQAVSVAGVSAKSAKRKRTLVAVRVPFFGRVYVVRGDRVQIVVVGRGKAMRFIGGRAGKTIAKRRYGDWYRVNKRTNRLLGGKQTRRRGSGKGLVILAYSQRALERRMKKPDLRVYVD